MSNIDHGFNVEVLSLSDTTLISSGTFNPEITGFDAPAGSIFLYKNLSQGHAFLKTGPNNTDWTELISDISDLIPAGAGLTYSGNALTVASGKGIEITSNKVTTKIYPGGGVILTTDGTTSSNDDTAAIALAPIGTPGNYKSVTVDVYGRIVSGTNPTTLAGYNILDAQPLDSDLTAIAAISATSGLLRKTAANTWQLDTNAYQTTNQLITLSGDVTGSGITAIPVTLANTGVIAGSYPKVVVDSKGRVINGITQISNTDISSVDWSKLTNVPSQIDDLTTGLYVEVMSMAIPNGVATLDPSAKLSPEQIPNINWSFITNEPTTLAGYGITDAQSTLISGTNIKTINGNTILGTGDLVVSAAAAGPTNSIQYNNAGAFAGQSNLIYDPATNRVTVSGATALQTRMTLLSGTTVDATQLNKSALYIQIDGDTTVEGLRTYFKRSTAGISGWITYHYDQATPNIRITDEDDDPPYISFRSIGNGSYDNPQYVSSFGARGPQAGVATGFSWWNRSSAESGTELMALDSNFLRLPKGTTAQRPTTVESGMIRFNTTTGKTEEYSGTYWKPAGGMILQVVTGTIGSLSGTTTVPLDNTVPTVTEGFQIFSQSFTPISATSTVVIEFSCTIAQSTNTTTPILSLFSGNTNIGSAAHSGNSARFQNIGVLEQFQPGVTTPVTISARIGAQAGSVYVNTGPAQTLGGALSSIYRIYEVE